MPFRSFKKRKPFRGQFHITFDLSFLVTRERNLCKEKRIIKDHVSFDLINGQILDST
jgi:hypothetical protein